PVFDTQVAAQVCGFGESVSYENIVGKILSLPVDKSSRFTDWSLRPLSEKQINYAMDDVIHLRKVYVALLEKMQRDGRGEWIEDEMQALLAISNYESDPNEVWKKLRLRNSSPRYLAAVRAVACWRELTAKERNLPRSRIMKDETVPEVANILPRDFASLQAIRGFYPTMSATHYQALFTIIEGLDLLTPADYPRLADKPSNQPSEAVSDLLKMLLKSCAAENQIVPRLLADKNDIDNLASGQYDDVKTLNGWRYEIFGKKALDLLAGKIAIKCDGKNNVVFEYSN
ncbi:MAG: HRDC domain-containing protein, partial [Pseudomonadota bacterium]